MTEQSQTPSETLRITYQKRPGLLKITLINLLFNILTLSIYRFWGKTNVRKHVWSSIHLNGEPLEYTGTGMELFKGFLVVLGVYLLPFVVLNTVLALSFGEGSFVYIAFQFVYILGFLLLFGYAIYKARRYQLTRTNWRGIRGNLVGSAWAYSLLYFGAMLANFFSLGWASPAMNTTLQNKISNEMRFGDASFKFSGSSRKLYPTFALCWIGALLLYALVGLIAYSYADTLQAWAEDIPNSGADKFFAYFIIGYLGFILVSAIIVPILWAIYMAKQLRTFAGFTRFDGAQFKLNATTISLIWLVISNGLIGIFTFGIAWPFIVQRNFKYFIDRLSLHGFVDIERIKQSTASVPTRGEGLADAFDVGAF